MKNIFNILLLALTAFVYASCSSDMDSDIEKDPNRIVKKTFKARANETRTSVSGTSVVWAANNKIYVASQEKNVGLKTFTLTKGVGSDDGTFSGEMTEAEDAPYIAVYTEQTSALTFSEGRVSNIVIPEVQHPVNGGFDPKCAPMTSYTTNDKMNFKHICSFIKIEVSSDLAAKHVKRITFKANKTTDVLTGTLDNVFIGTKGIVSSYDVHGETGSHKVILENSGTTDIAAGTYYIAVLPAALENGFEIKFETVNLVYKCKKQSGEKELKRAYLHSLGTFDDDDTSWTDTYRPEILYGGEFTVADDDGTPRKVHFSSGNLWAVMEGPTKVKKWKFADNQWSIIRDGGGNLRRDNCQDGDVVSLFDWVRDGLYDDGVKQYGILTGTQATSETCTGAGEAGLPPDWGAMYKKATDSDYDWRVLTLEEWQYLLTGSRGADQNYASCLAQVNGVNGLIIFPDGFSFSGLTVSPPTAYAGKGKTGTDWNKPYDTNQYTVDDWTELEENGCMFLPAEGEVNSKSWGNTGNGYYMTYDKPSNTSTGQVYSLYFANKNISTTANSHYATWGKCIRLVALE